MKAKKEPIHGGNHERAQEQAALQGSTFSNDNFITDKSRTQGHIEALLQYGEQNAIPARELVKLTGYSSTRTMQTEIEHERAEGALILSKCSEGGGYYLPCSRAEIVRYEKTLRQRALSTLRTLKTAHAALQMIEGQEGLNE